MKLAKNIWWLIIYMFFICGDAESQFVFKFDGSSSSYSKAENISDAAGISAGQIDLNVLFNAANSIDTSAWKMITNSDNGKYSEIQNKESYNGIDPGLIKIPMIYLVNGFSFDTLKFARKDTAQVISHNWTFEKNVTVNRILYADTILPNANNSGALGSSAQRYKTLYTGTSVDILGADNKMKLYYDATHGFEISSNATSGVMLNNITAFNSDMYFQLGGSSKIALSNYSSKNVFRPVISNVFFGDAGDRWGKSYFADNMDITWTTNVDAGFLRGASDTDMTGIYLRSPNGTKHYITVDDSGVLNTSTSPF